MVAPQFSQPASSEDEPFTQDLRPLHAHAAHTLAGSTFNGDTHPAVLRPDASANAVLAIGNDGELLGAVHLMAFWIFFFEVFRSDPFFVNIAFDYHCSSKK